MRQGTRHCFEVGVDTDVTSAQFVTVTTLYAGSTTTTSTVLPAAAGQTGTVFIQIPRQYSTATSFYTGTVTSTVTVLTPTTVGQTGQIVVQVPNPSTSVSHIVFMGSNTESVIPLTLQQYTTTTTYYAGTTTSTSTFAPATAGQPGTVVVYNPQVYTTTTSVYAGTTASTTTIPGQPATVVIYSPQVYTTTTSVYAGTTASTTTVPGQPATVIVYSPQVYTTVTSVYAGTTASTTTVPGQPATVIVYSPQQYTTTTSYYAGSTASTTTIAPATAGQLGTVIIYSPEAYITTTSYYAGSTASTTTIAPATAGQPATVIVYSPQAYVTTTSYYAGSTASTTTIAPATAGQPATVIVYSPQAYTTTTSYYPGSTTSTTTVAPATAGQPATVIVFSPQVYTTTTSYYTGTVASTSTGTPATPGQAATVVVFSPQGYTTTTSYYAGTVVSTSTGTPAIPGQTATVVVFSPQNYVTTTSYYTGSTASTTTIAPATAGQPATVVIYSPRVYTTTTALYTGATAATVTETQATPGATFTVVVQQPRTYTTVTSTRSGSVTATVTEFTPTVPGQTGTVVVEVPPLNTITVTTGGVSFTSTSTTTVSGVASQIAVVGVPVRPYYLYITDITYNPLGYLDLNPTPYSGTAYSAYISNFGAASNFYVDAATNSLAVNPASGISSQPLYGVQKTAGGPFLFDTSLTAAGNTPIRAGYWPDGSLQVVNTANGNYIANLCNGIVTINPGTVAGCTQIVLNPTYDAINYTTTTVTAGSVSSTRTLGPNGYTVSQGGTVTQYVPVPTCTATGLAYTGYNNPYTYFSGQSFIDPDWLAFNASYFNGLPATSALFSGITTGNINFNTAGGVGLYGSARNMVQVSLVFRGYFMPPVTGNYTLETTAGDDIVYIYMGIPANTSTWGATNYLSRDTLASPTIANISQLFVYGRLYPIVILYANGAGDGAMQITITTGTGTKLTDTSGYFLQPPCGTAGIPTATRQPIAPTTCAATGIEYINRPAPTTTAGAFGLPAAATFNPDNYSPPTATPYSNVRFEGLVNNIALAAPAPATSVQVYGKGTYDLTQSAFFFRGYFVANITGSHTFSLNQPDDVGYMWFGPNAISGWNAANSVIRAATVSGPSGTYTTTLTAGVLTPIRLAFANAGGATSFTLTVRDPNGVSQGNTAGFFVQPWCGGANQYSSWT
jgi:hypothetical protein